VECLLEREDELELLASVAREAMSGGGAMVLVGGEAGIGKTSLVRALRERLGERVTVLVGACEPLSVPVPLGPLRELLEAAGGRDLIELGSDDRLVLARSVLGALAERAPAVAVIEDLHWADPMTLDLIRLLARRVEEAGVALVVTYRDDEVAANRAAAMLLGDLATSSAVRRVVLRPLSESAVRELAGPRGLDAAEVARATGGNPFLVVETIAAGSRLPQSVRDAALARAARLGAAARGAVDAAAVLGQRFPPPLLESLVPGSADAVDEALARGVLVADGAVLGFRHELIREAIESSISPPRREELHRRAVAALTQQDGGADYVRLAHHAELGGLIDEGCRYACLAAAEAERVGAVREMELQAGRALRLGAELAPSERLELLIRYSRAANFSSAQIEDAATAAERAVALAGELGDRAGRGRALVALAWALWSLDRVDEAKRAAEQAIAALEPTGEAGALARAHSTDIRMEATAFDPAAAIASGPRALELAAAAGLEEVRIDIAISVALARGHRGDREALALLSEVLREAQTTGRTIQTVRCYVNLAYVGALLREHALVDETVTAALRVFDDYGTPIPGHAIHTYLARSLLDRGRWDEAVAAAKRSETTWHAEVPVARSTRGLIRARRGEPGAVELLERGWRELERVAESSRHGLVRLALVEDAWLRGDGATALAHLRAARDSPATARFARSASELALWASRLGVEFEAPDNLPAPVALELAGNWRGAARTWRELDAPYEAALAALPGDDRAAREALATLHRLGAAAAARAFTRERVAAGARAARGPRRSTLANAAGLTRREQEVLGQLATGATNAAIAAALHLSERTVAHHVSAILGKLGAPNRTAALEEARRRGVLAQDRPSGSQR
jgi:DNA-binding CsgD family transcriptional regulator/tetratricopeptide (TPR) repeat protein